MKIQSVHIQKFRSIDDSKIDFTQVLALVGQNNAGKSHVLRALNAFFNFERENNDFLNFDHMFSSRARPKIIVSFDNITPDDQVDSIYIHNSLLTIRFTYRWDRRTPTYEVLVGNNLIKIDIDTFKTITKHFKYIYIPIVRNYDVAFSKDNGVAYALLKNVLQQQIANRNTIQPIVSKLKDKVNTTVFKQAVKLIEQYYPFSNNSKFKLKINDIDLIDTVLHDVTLSLVENTQINEINNCGSGIQSAVFFAISLAISMGSSINHLIGVEEPELNMHPQAQRQLIDALNKPTKYPNAQFILTTHSTVIVDKLGHSSIALCRKQKGATRDIITSITQIDFDFWNKYQMTEERYYNFFAYKNSDFVFSNYIIITESTNDCNVVSALLNHYDVDVEALGISLIPSSGEKSVKYPYSIAKELGIPFLCIVDRDVFQPYINSDRKSSLDEKGIPQYRNELKTSSPILDLISENDQTKILDYLSNNKYKELCNLLKQYNIICMRYALEVDLVNCSSYCDAFCNHLNIVGSNRTSRFLLTERGNKIKDYDVITNVLQNTSTKNLPASYKQIVQHIKNL